jgi:hypothetical protein
MNGPESWRPFIPSLVCAQPCHEFEAKPLHAFQPLLCILFPVSVWMGACVCTCSSYSSDARGYKSHDHICFRYDGCYIFKHPFLCIAVDVCNLIFCALCGYPAQLCGAWFLQVRWCFTKLVYIAIWNACLHCVALLCIQLNYVVKIFLLSLWSLWKKKDLIIN